ncbi:MAG TPA: ABC transporter permease [Smithellaceae bacterium]|nr:ABC transporter permease [Syntrophaceae bacterium]MDX9816725.1 ABC transporter permease [Smithellaceae bacterium]NMD06151.1 ABC transporter permease [Deltaproteobacteria bacterium]MBP8609127.1 ABC transporter permease [Syntrophaceae bacterium]HNZ32517.1 ABC transporter permease [Smithellaceae bacterium]
MNFVRLKAIIRKEIYHLLRDYQSLYLAFAIPLILIILFGYALSLDVDKVETVVVDYDKSALSRDFVRKIDASPYFHLAGHLDRAADAVSFLDRDAAKVAIIIGPDFMKNLQADREAQLQILIEGSDPNFAGIIRGYLTVFTEQYNQKILFDFLNRQGMTTIKPPVDGRIRIWFNEDLESRNFIIPGIIAIIIMIVGALLTSLIIAREYENGTMETLKSLPVKAGELLLGKAIPYFFIGLTDVLIAMLLGQLLFGVVMKGNFLLMMLATALYLFVALALGLLISTATKSQLVANQMAVIITYLPSVLLSNFVFPIVNMPKVLQMITYIVPARYYIDILGGVYLRDTGIAYLWPSMAVLAFLAVLLTFFNYLLLKKEGL